MNISHNSEHDEATLAEAKTALRQGRFSDARVRLHQLLKRNLDEAKQTEALYILAVAQRYERHFDDAMTTLARLRELAPAHARAWQEVGHIHFTLDEFDRATTAYEMALQRNPMLLASWKALANLYGMRGEDQRQRMAVQKVSELSALPPELRSVKSLIHEDKLEQADQLCRTFLRTNRHHLEGLRLLGELGVLLGALDEAEFVLESAVELDPAHYEVRFDFANVLLKRQKFQLAHEQTTRLVEMKDDDLAALSLLGSAKAGVGDAPTAIQLFDQVLAQSHNQPAVWVMRGHAQKTIGEFDAAIESYRRAYQVEPSYGDAFWSLANTKVYAFSQEEIDLMREQEAAGSIGRDDRIHMCFALGKAYEDRAEYAESFHYYERGNEIKHESVIHQADMLARRVSAQVDVCQHSLFEDRPTAGCPAPDPIFVVGLPRAGSTLLEQILASHSMIDGTLELPHILSLVNRLRNAPGTTAGTAYPAILESLDTAYFRRFGEQYIEQTQVFRAGAARFVDKMPNNFFHLGLIKLILPNAKVIDARRHPMSCCFSGFKQLFGEGQEFTYGLTSVGNYYRKYVELMDHWHQVLPGFVLTVQHEDVVDDLEGQVRRILEFCELPFEDQCLRYYETQRSVRTPSSEQVRQPIFRSALDHWKHYDPWLGPLKEALGPTIRRQYEIS